MPNDDPGPVLEIRLQTPGWGDVCWNCGGDASGSHGLPVFNGDLVSNGWPGEWVGVPACRPCHDLHAAGKLPVCDHLYRYTLYGHGFMDGAGI